MVDVMNYTWTALICNPFASIRLAFSLKCGYGYSFMPLKYCIEKEIRKQYFYKYTSFIITG